MDHDTHDALRPPARPCQWPMCQCPSPAGCDAARQLEHLGEDDTSREMEGDYLDPEPEVGP